MRVCFVRVSLSLDEGLAAVLEVVEYLVWRTGRTGACHMQVGSFSCLALFAQATWAFVEDCGSGSDLHSFQPKFVGKNRLDVTLR